MAAQPDAPHLVLGEALFDVFPDGQRVLGGAPFNVAWNLHQFGEPVLFVGGIGDDPEGAGIRERMQAIGMDPRGLYVHPAAPTGRVTVELEAGEPRYSILPDQAYDDVPAYWADQLPQTTPLLYHGTLALRSGNRDLLERLQPRAGRRFVDVNLRAPWFGAADVHELIRGADVVKLNRDELEILVPGRAERDRAAALLESAALREALVVTAGAEGAAIHPASGDSLFSAAPQVADLRDTVGAGDAFASVVILGLHRGWAWPDILRRALTFAARVCTLQGATTTDRGFYRAAGADWPD